MSLVNLGAIKALLEQTQTPHRIQLLDLWGELEMMADSTADVWPPKARPGETILALGNDVSGQPVAVFLTEAPTLEQDEENRPN
ncbi:MAG: hypothetical protein ACRDDI_14240 [Aeromonas veronii]